MLDQDYIRTARGKRLPRRHVYLRHALPNTLTATLTIAGLLLGGLIAGTVLVENVFAWPGPRDDARPVVVRRRTTRRCRRWRCSSGRSCS